jgi:hypothetical protein
MYEYMLLVLASAVFLGSESLGTRDHILLIQIRDFRFCRLLQLAGSQQRVRCVTADETKHFYKVFCIALGYHFLSNG